jgi:hypothetical protein
MSNLILFTPKSYVIGLPIINADKHHKYSQEIVDMCKSGLSGCNLNLLDFEGLNGCFLNFIKIAPENPVLRTGMKGVSAKSRKNLNQMLKRA